MAKVPYIPLYIGDWEQDTNCLSLQAEAAWLKVIFKMHKDDKSGIYKTSTKSLQNLWKTDTKGVQDILNELIENDICGLELGEQIIFTNRRMVRDREISQKRTKAVQTRYKTSTKSLQNTEYENEYDNEIESVKRGVQGGKYQEDLSASEIGQTIEYIRFTRYKFITEQEVQEYWKAYLIHSTGEIYHNRSRRLQHFRNWIKHELNGATYRDWETNRL